MPENYSILLTPEDILNLTNAEDRINTMQKLDPQYEPLELFTINHIIFTFCRQLPCATCDRFEAFDIHPYRYTQNCKTWRAFDNRCPFFDTNEDRTYQPTKPIRDLTQEFGL